MHAPAWSIVNVALEVPFPICTAPTRVTVWGFAATEIPTLPLEVPLDPEAIVIHGAWLTADHWQPVPVLRANVVVPPLPETE